MSNTTWWWMVPCVPISWKIKVEPDEYMTSALQNNDKKYQTYLKEADVFWGKAKATAVHAQTLRSKIQQGRCRKQGLYYMAMFKQKQAMADSILTKMTRLQQVEAGADQAENLMQDMTALQMSAANIKQKMKPLQNGNKIDTITDEVSVAMDLLTDIQHVTENAFSSDSIVDEDELEDEYDQLFNDIKEE